MCAWGVPTHNRLLHLSTGMCVTDSVLAQYFFWTYILASRTWRWIVVMVALRHILPGLHWSSQLSSRELYLILFYPLLGQDWTGGNLILILRPSPVGRETRDSGENPSWEVTGGTRMTSHLPVYALFLFVFLAGLRFWSWLQWTRWSWRRTYRYFEWMVSSSKWTLKVTDGCYRDGITPIACRGCNCALWD